MIVDETVSERRPCLALFDLDGTITKQDTYIAYLAGYFLRHPKRWAASHRLISAVWRFKTGRRDNGWLKERFLSDIFGGLSREQVDGWNAQFLPKLFSSGLRAGALHQLAVHAHRGDRTILLTASLDLYVNDLASYLGVREVVSTRVEWSHGRLTGRLRGKNIYGEQKVRRISELLDEDRCAWHVVAYADHYSDIDLLCWADRGVVVCPHPKLARYAAERGLKIASW